jgi:hypothetical protein
MTNEERMQHQIDELKADFAQVLEYVAAIHVYLGEEMHEHRMAGTALGDAHAKHVSQSHARAVNKRMAAKAK